ncbi:MAG: methyltransferase [Ignavibacteria bacterium]|nr:methyltransferase [Ignavibacteria bacterium]
MDRRTAETPEIDWSKYPVPRVRHHVNSQAYLPAHQHLFVHHQYPPLRTDAEWGSWFANSKPASVLDLGCGRGAFLIRHALTHPNVNILGVEVRESLADYINGVISGEGLKNAHALWYTLANGLDWIQPGSIDYAVYLFPDPWPKKRHHKRRAFSQGFLKMVHRVLVPGGRLYLATDRENVDAYQREVLSASSLFSISPLMDDTTWPFRFTTDQQMFCDAKGIPYVRYAAEKC